MNPTIHIHRAQQSAARIQALAEPHRPVTHAQPIISPARPQQGPRNAWVGLALCIGLAIAFAAAVGLAAGILLRNH